VNSDNALAIVQKQTMMNTGYKEHN